MISMIDTSDVRIAQPEEEEAVMEMCRMLHSENGQHPFDDDKVRWRIRRALNRENSLLCVIGEPNDLRGMLLLLIDSIWYSSDYQLLELFNYVHPDHRRSDYAKKLIAYAKRCSEGLGIDLTIGVLSHERMEAKVRLYQRQLPEAGRFFVYHGGRANENAA